MTYILETKEQFLQYRVAFKQFSHRKMAKVEDHLLYNLLRAKDPKHGFTPISNEGKLRGTGFTPNPHRAYALGRNSLFYNIKHRKHLKDWYIKYGAPNGSEMPFCLKYGDTVTEEMWEKIAQAEVNAK